MDNTTIRDYYNSTLALTTAITQQAKADLECDTNKVCDSVISCYECKISATNYFKSSFFELYLKALGVTSTVKVFLKYRMNNIYSIVYGDKNC